MWHADPYIRNNKNIYTIMRSLSLHTAATAILALSAVAAPTANQAATIRQMPTKPPNTQYCLVTEIGGGPNGQQTKDAQYTIMIGEPYADGIGCNALYTTINKAMGGAVQPTQWGCIGSGNDDDNTFLLVVTPAHSEAKLNEALEKFYPMVAGGFNCPDCTDC